ncbi:hypothetical protein [Lactobacillus sp. ESL0681]|uniref:hypothetical protein n=1 Tax=Lactobacillus sp. ESL0681 TaxID=2983211 RepID=UPI0023F68F87|nr:hypothetical protein [Lactobacillus sp. ESL0681]WEV39880.1 hypothetical protein OZX59_06625 [Lactobacillus sp. ESL0681]
MKYKREFLRQVRSYPDNLKKYRLGDTVVGESVWWRNSIHPYSLNFAAWISPTIDLNYQTQTFTQILDFLQKRAKNQGLTTLITKDYAPQLLFNSLAQAANFALVRTTVQPQLLLASLELTNLTIPEGFEIISYSDLKKRPTAFAALAKLNYHDYQISHILNPVAKIGLTEWERTIYNAVLPEAPIALIKDQQFLAYCFLFEDEPGTLTLGWMGAIEPEYLDILQNIQLDWAKGKYQQLAGEFDSTDQLAMHCYQRFPFELCPVYETYKKEI